MAQNVATMDTTIPKSPLAEISGEELRDRLESDHTVRVRERLVRKDDETRTAEAIDVTLPTEVYTQLIRSAIPDPLTGEYSSHDVLHARYLAQLLNDNRGWRKYWNGFLRKTSNIPSWACKTATSFGARLLKYLIDGGSEHGGLLIKALDGYLSANELTQALFQKSVGRFIADMAFDAGFLLAHLKTSTRFGQVISICEFLIRQFGPMIKIPVATVWTDYIWPLLTRFTSPQPSLSHVRNKSATEESSTPLEANGLDTPAAWMEALASSAAYVGCLAAGNEVVKDREVSKVVNSWGNLGRDVGNMERGAKTLSNLVSTAVEWCKKAILYFWPEAKLGLGVAGEFNNAQINIAQFLELHAELSDITQRQKLCAAYGTLPKLQRAIDLGNLITKALVSEQVKVAASVRQEICQMRKDIGEFSKYFQHHRISPANRRCPFVVQFVGDPGCGKSESMIRTAQELPELVDLLDLNGNKKAVPGDEAGFNYHDDGLPKVWKKGGGSKYDDGYNPELKVMTWDDIFSCGADTPESSDGLWMLNAVSSMACPMNMADIPDKGIEFQCLLMVLSGNVAHPRFAEMRSDEAVWRRRNILVQQHDSGLFEVLNPLKSEKTVITTFRSFDELLPYMAAKCAQFLALPMHGTKLVTAEQKVARALKAQDFLAAGADEKVCAPSEDADPMVRDPIVVYDVAEARFARDRDAEVSLEVDISLRERCSCCGSRSCELDLLHKCQFWLEAEEDVIFEQAMRAEGVWYCGERGVLYQEDFVVVPTLIMATWDELNYNWRSIIEKLVYTGHNDFAQLFWEMYPHMPGRLQQYAWEGKHLANAWNWTVKRRLENLWAFLDKPAEPEYLPDNFEDVMMASGSESDDVADDYPLLVQQQMTEWEETRWTSFCEFVRKANEYVKTGCKKAFDACYEVAGDFLVKTGEAVLTFIFVVGAAALYIVAALTALHLGCKIYLSVANLFNADTSHVMGTAGHNGPSGGDARTTRVARMRVSRMRANAIEESVEVFRQELTERGFTEVADAMEETLRRKHPEMFAAGVEGYTTLSESFLEKNLFEFEFEYSSSEGVRKYSMQGLGMTGNLALVPWHYASRFNNSEPRDVKLTFKGKTWDLKIVKDDFMRCKDADGKVSPDCAVLRLDARIGQFKNMIKHIVPLDAHAELDGMQTEIPSKKKGVEHIHHAKVQLVKKTSTYGDKSPGLAIDDTYIQPVVYQYAVDADKIICGAPLVLTGPITKGCVFGMHVAMNTKGTSFAIPLDYEFVSRNVEAARLQFHAACYSEIPPWSKGTVLGVPTSEISTFDPYEKALSVYPEGDMEYVATLKNGWEERVCNKTDIRPSPIHGVFPVETGPSVKTKRDPRLMLELQENPEYTPLNEGAKKYSEPTKPFHPRAVELAVRYMLSILLLVRPLGGIARKLTESEAINGVRAWGYTRLNMLTSAGWPHKRLKNPYFGTKGKRFLFENENDPEDEDDIVYRIRDPILRQDVDNYEENLRNRKRTFLVTYSNLKDERRKLAKVLTGQTRLFDCMSLPHTMMVRKYFGAFVSTMNARCVEGHSAVGIDPEGPQWSALFRRLNRFGGNVIAGDYKQWDGKLDPEIMMRAVRVINQWYQEWGVGDWSPVDDVIRQILISDVIRCYTIYGNTVVLKTQGLPSGMAITADLNSLCNALYILTAFYTLRPSVEIRPQDSMEVSCYGDDHLIAIIPSILAWFNFNTLQKHFAEHGITYTDAMKRGGEVPDSEPLENGATFLKRKFVRHPMHTRYLMAPIEETTITEMANWIRKTPREMDALMSNLKDLQRFAYHHGKDYYERTVEKVNRALKAYRRSEAAEVSWKLLEEDYEDMDLAWLEKFHS
jgi:hypothetical protein